MRKTVLLLALTTLILESCTIVKPKFSDKELVERKVLTFTNPRLVTKFKVSTYILPPLLFVPLTFLGASQIKDEKTGAKLSQDDALGITGIVSVSAIGYYYFYLSQRAKEQNEKINVTNNDDATQWWIRMHKKKKYKDFEIYEHYNGNYVHENTIVAIRTDYFGEYYSKFRAEEEKREREKYANMGSGMSFTDWIKVAVVTYVGYKVVKEVFNSTSTPNQKIEPKNDFEDSDFVKDSYCSDEDCGCWNYTCHTTGRIVRVEKSCNTQSEYNVTLGFETRKAVTIEQAKTFAKQLTNCR